MLPTPRFLSWPRSTELIRTAAFFPESITPIAAPRPLLRFLHQPPRHGIAVHVAQLLDALARRPDIEIIEPLLPHMLRAKRK